MYTSHVVHFACIFDSTENECEGSAPVDTGMAEDRRGKATVLALRYISSRTHVFVYVVVYFRQQSLYD